MADTGQPTLHSLTLSDSVDFASDPFLAIMANVSDPDGIYNVQLHFTQRLLGVGEVANRTHPVIWGYGNWFSGSQTFRYQIDKINEPGAYVLGSVSIVDGQYNHTSISAQQLSALGVDIGFTLSGTTPDRTAPILQTLNLPASIDTSKGPALWKLDGLTTDDLSGTYAVGIVLDKPFKQANWISEFSKPDISHYVETTNVVMAGPAVSGGKTSSAFWIAAQNGVYGIEGVWVSDESGNSVRLDQARLREMGITTQIVVSDGRFVAPTIAADVSTLPRTADSDGIIVLSLSANQWRSSSNSIDLNIDYDATQARFDGWRAGGEGAYALSAQTLEVGVAGQTRVTGTIDNGGEHNGFLDLRFKASSTSGTFDFDLYGMKINGATVLDGIGQAPAYRIQTLASGSDAANVLTGSSGDDYLDGLGGADLFIESAGTDTFAGGAGRDLARYASQRADYTVRRDGADIVVASKYNATDIDRLQSVETIAFGDVRMEFDPNGHAAQIFRLFQTAFDRAPKAAGLGFWVKAAESGVSMHRIASDFVASEEFKALHAKDASHAAIVDSFYRNALDRAPDLQGFHAWTSLLERRELDVAQVLLGFAESQENRDNTAELIGQGMTYLPG